MRLGHDPISRYETLSVPWFGLVRREASETWLRVGVGGCSFLSLFGLLVRRVHDPDPLLFERHFLTLRVSGRRPPSHPGGCWSLSCAGRHSAQEVQQLGFLTTGCGLLSRHP